jgi:hypothetical protein
MKEEWLMSGAVVPVDVETTAALVAEIRRLIDVVGGMALAQPDAFEQGRQEGLKQERALWTLTKVGQEIEAQPAQRPWVGLTNEEIKEIVGPWGDTSITGYTRKLFDQIEAKLKEKNT